MEVLIHEASNKREIIDGTSSVNYHNDANLNGNKITMPERKEKDGNDLNVSYGKKINEINTVDIIFENITYTVPLGFRKGRKEILHGINGRLNAKQLIALMGPSGAGKSSLLDVLSGFRETGVDGVIYVNGRIRELRSFSRCSAYITQNDCLEPLLTVLESMRVAADLKLPTNTPKYQKETVIEEILTTLGLYEHMNTRTGQLSGGQKKRLSVALELVNNPTVMFLDEPTTGLDSSSCMQVVKLLKLLARQGRTIICTIHQPSASIFKIFDHIYLLGKGNCLYQGSTEKLIPYLESMNFHCPIYHNPADYMIELACGEYGDDKLMTLVNNSENGRNLQWFEDHVALKDAKTLRALHPLKELKRLDKTSEFQATPLTNQIYTLLRRGLIMYKRDVTLIYLRIIVNVSIGLLLGMVFNSSGNDGDRVLDNYNLLFSILIHHMMTTMMLTIVTCRLSIKILGFTKNSCAYCIETSALKLHNGLFLKIYLFPMKNIIYHKYLLIVIICLFSVPMQLDKLIKEHFNRWYSLKAFYMTITLLDIPVSTICCLLFTIIIYPISSQPLEIGRFFMFFTISLLVSFIAQGTGLMIGAVLNVVNGTFVGPALAVPLMMFAGFGVSLRDLPNYLKWGSYISFLRYGLEGFVGAIYGMDRAVLPCTKNEEPLYCHYKYPSKFLSDIAMNGDQFWNDVIALLIILLITRVCAFFLLKWKIFSLR